MSVKGIIMFIGMNSTRLERKILIILDFENGFLPTYLPQCPVRVSLGKLISCLIWTFHFIAELQRKVGNRQFHGSNKAICWSQQVYDCPKRRIYCFDEMFKARLFQLSGSLGKLAFTGSSKSDKCFKIPLWRFEPCNLGRFGNKLDFKSAYLCVQIWLP